MTIPDMTVWGAFAAVVGYAFRYLKKEADGCKKDRKILSEKVSTLTSIIAVFADRLNIEVDFSHTPTLSEMEGHGRAMRQARKIETAAPTDKIELRPRPKTQRARLSELNPLEET